MDKEALFKAFKIAIDREEEAAEFYTDLAKRNIDPELKKLFGEFAEQELIHFQKLKDQYRIMRGEIAD